MRATVRVHTFHIYRICTWVLWSGFTHFIYMGYTCKNYNQGSCIPWRQRFLSILLISLLCIYLTYSINAIFNKIMNESWISESWLTQPLSQEECTNVYTNALHAIKSLPLSPKVYCFTEVKSLWTKGFSSKGHSLYYEELFGGHITKKIHNSRHSSNTVLCLYFNIPQNAFV